MHAVVLYQGKLELMDRPSPVPGSGEVVVSVRAAGINGADRLQQLGFYAAPEGWPADIPGLEIAGVVTHVGDGVDSLLLGKRVCAIVGGGAHASECVVPAEHLLFPPDHLSWVHAGGVAETFTTAFDALVTQAKIQPGERVLISGANGGVGTAAVQLAAALGGHVVAVTRDARHHADLIALGAHEAVTLDDVASLAPVDVVIELVGATHLTQAMTVLSPHARVVIVGVGGGSRLDLDLLTLMTRRASVMGATLRARSREEKATIATSMNQLVMPLLAAGTMQVPIDRTFALDDAAAAYDYFATASKFGKVILVNEE